MGTNFLVQFILQPILIFELYFILQWVCTLIFKKKNSRPIGYAVNNPSDNSSWISRNMIVTGVMILLFMALHFYDFWVPEIKYKYIDFKPESSDRYFEELTHKFKDSWRVIIYCVSFVFLSLHLLHGFGSAFQSVGLKSKSRASKIKFLSNIYAIIVPAGFVFIALFHFIKQIG